MTISSKVLIGLSIAMPIFVIAETNKTHTFICPSPSELTVLPNKLFAINPEYGQWNVIANNTPSLMPSGFEFKRLNAECKFGECKPTCVYIVSNEPNVALFATPFSFAFPVYTEEQVKQYESGCQAKNVNECKISFETQNN